MIDLFSEIFPPTGGMTADGFKRLLGRPSLSMLQTVIREALQNVVDAGAGSRETRVAVRLRNLDDVESANLRSRIFKDLPANQDSHQRLSSSLSRRPVRVLEICDFGTVGLSGPTGADKANNDEEPINFINFMRNIGAVRDTHQGGGTYGYGKSSLYAMSRCSTILVDSQTTDAGVAVRRLMACHLGHTFEHRGSRYTGRHWWGVNDEKTIEPCVGELATELAKSLGLPDRSPDNTGTSILILDPELDDSLSNAQHCKNMIEAILWNFWPRMTRDISPERRLNVEVFCDGNPVEVPAPEMCPPLDLYARAMVAIRNGSADAHTIRHASKRRDLGKLSLYSGIYSARTFSETDSNEAAQGATPASRSHHIALMRPVELVVRYLPLRPMDNANYEWAGVFVCSHEEDIESAFAQSEPPAHDDWMVDNLPRGDARNFVSMALRRIKQTVDEYLTPSITGNASDGQGPSLAKVAGVMGQFLDTYKGDSPGKIRKPGRKSQSKKKPIAVSPPQFTGFRTLPNGTSVACFQCRLTNDGSDPKLRLVATPMLAIDGGASVMEGANELNPTIVAMGFESGLDSERSGSLLVGTKEGVVQILTTLAEDAAVKVLVALQPGNEK